MGVVLNPVAFRIGHLISWSDAWYMHRINYPAFLHNMLLIKTLVYYLIFYCYPEKRSLWLYSHANLYLYNYKIFVNVFIYSTIDNILIKTLVRKLKWKKYKSIRLKTYWYKKQLLDKNYRLQNIFLIMQVLRLNVDKILLDSLNYKFSFWKVKKINRLKKKYGRDWIAHEEISMLKRVFSSFLYGYNMYGFDYLANYYSQVYYRAEKIRFSASRRFKQRKKDLFFLKHNYRYLFFLFSFLDFVAFKFNQSYPYKNFRRRTLSGMIKIFVFWFCIRPIFFQFAKLIEILILKFGFRVKARMFILSNACLSALFIARFFAFAFKYKFNFKDMMKPLKKTLKRLMFVRRMRSSGKVKNALKRSLKRTRNRVINYGFFIENTIGSIISNILIFFEVRRMKTILCYKRGIHFKRFRTLRYFYFDFLKNYHIYKSAWYKAVWWFKVFKDRKRRRKRRKKKHFYRWKRRYLKFVRFKIISKLIILKKLLRVIKYVFVMLKQIRIKLKFYNFFKRISFFLLTPQLKLRKKFRLKNFINHLYKFNFFKLKKFRKIKFNLFFNLLVVNLLNTENVKIKFNYLLSNFWQFEFILIIYDKLNYFKIDKLFAYYNLGRTFHRIYSKINYNYFKRYFQKKKYKFDLKNKKWKFLKNITGPVYYYYKWNKKPCFNNNYFFVKFGKKKKLKRYNKFLNYIRRNKLLLYKHKFFYYFYRRLKNKLWMFHTKNRKIRKILRYDIIILKKIEKLFKKMKRRNLKKFLKLKKKFDPKYMKKREDRNLFKSMHRFMKGFNKRKFIKNRKQLNNEFINSYGYKKNKKFNKRKRRSTKRHIITEYSHFLQNLIFYFFWRKFAISFYLYKPYAIHIGLKLNYIKKLNNFTNIFMKYYRQMFNNKMSIDGKQILPLRHKLKRLKHFDSEKAVLYGYKFHFKGRFTRKQRAASLWFTKGAVSSSTMAVNVDYGFYSIRLRYSICTAKIWLYRGRLAPIFRQRLV